MAKRRRRTRTIEEAAKRKTAPEPKLTHAGFQISLWAIVLALVVQVVMAIIVYPTLPDRIPATWAGSLIKGETVPSWLVFFLFPGGQVILFLIAVFSPRDNERKLVMEFGKAATLVVLSILFTTLQASAFYIP